MAETPPKVTMSWLEASGCTHLFRSFRLAIHHTNILLALMAVVSAWIWGSLLDAAWPGAESADVWKHIAAIETTVEPEAEESTPVEGIFKQWTMQQRWCLESAMVSVRHGSPWGIGADMTWQAAVGQIASKNVTDRGSMVAAPIGVLPCGILLFKGTAWMVRQHFWFAMMFFGGGLAIWSLFGGAICRMTAVQLTRDEKLSIPVALGYARTHYWSGFFSAPLLTVVMFFALGSLLIMAGAFLRVPLLGDVLGSLFLGLSLILGLGAALVLIGVIFGGPLFWPNVAIEGCESLDAVSRSFHYVGANPWRTLFCWVVAVVYGSLCLVFVRFVVFLALKVTHTFLGLGTSPFGWWQYGAEAGNKIDVIWPAPTFEQFQPAFESPDGLAGFAHFVIWLWIALAGKLVWAFTASFFFSAATATCLLLRRQTDGVDMEDIYIDTYEAGEFDATAAAPAMTVEPPPPASVGVQLTLKGKAVEVPADKANGEP